MGWKIFKKYLFYCTLLAPLLLATFAFGSTGRELLIEAIDNYNFLDYKNSIIKTKSAVKVLKNPEDLVSAYTYMGASYVAQDKIPEAVEAFSKMLDVDPNASLDPSEFSPKFTKVFEQAKKRARGKVVVVSKVPGVSVDVDAHFAGKSSPGSPLKIDVTAGKHSIRVYRDDHEPETMKFKIDASEVKKLQFTLKKKKFGELEFVSNINGGQIFLDGKLLKRVSLSTVKNTVLKKIAEGKHRILIKKKNYHSFKTEVVLSDLKKTIVTIDLQPVKGSLDIFIDKEGTEIFLDEKSYGKTTSPNDTIALKSLTPGKYKLSGKLKGHITAEQPVEVRPGSNTKVKLVIKPGIFLSVKTSPAPSEILINGEKKGESPLLSPVQPGTVVRVRVILDGYRAPAMVFSMKKDREINIRLIKESAYTFYREGQKNEDIFEKLLLKQGGKKGENSKKLLGQYLKQARGLYKKATLEDPMYAMAYASLGRVLLRKLEKEKQDGKKGSSRNIVNTIVHSQKAIDLNNDLLAKAVALNVMGGINLFKGNQEGSGEKKITWYNEAVKSFDKAIAFFKSAEISMDYRSIDLAGAYYKRAIAFENIALNQKGGNQTFLYAACQAWKTFSFEGSHRSGSLSEKIMSAYRKTSTEHRVTFCQD